MSKDLYEMLFAPGWDDYSTRLIPMMQEYGWTLYEATVADMEGFASTGLRPNSEYGFSKYVKTAMIDRGGALLLRDILIRRYDYGLGKK